MVCQKRESNVEIIAILSNSKSVTLMSMLNLKGNAININGFTLLEFIIVFSLFAILISCTPVFFRAFERHKLYSAAKTIAADLRLAQQLSMNQDTFYTMLFDCENERYYIQRESSTYKKVNLPEGINLVATNFDFDNKPSNGLDHRLRFNAKGEPYREKDFLAGGHITICNKNDDFLFIVVASITGRVRVDTKPPP